MIYPERIMGWRRGARLTLSEAQKRKLDWHIAAAESLEFPVSGFSMLDGGCAA